MKVITVTEKTSGVKYDIMIGTGLIFDYQNKKVFNCTDDTDEAEWSDQIFTFEIEGKEVIFYLVEVLSYDTIKDMAEVIRIQEIENDLSYMKNNGEHVSSCSGCEYEQHSVNEIPCNICKNYDNYSKKDFMNNLSKCCNATIRYLDCAECKEKGIPCEEIICTSCGASIKDSEEEIINSHFPNEFREKQTDYMNDICGPLKETFGKKSDNDKIVDDIVTPIFDKLKKDLKISDNKDTYKIGYNTTHQRLDELILSKPDVLEAKPRSLGYTQQYIDNFKKCLENGTTPALEEIKLQEQIKEHIKFIIDYLWDIEMKNFSETFEVSIQSQDDLQQWIDWCENYIMTHDNLEIGEDPINHIFYHLMKLKKLYNL